MACVRAAGASTSTPEPTTDTAASGESSPQPPKNLSPALARALARKQKAQQGAGGGGAAAPSPSPSPQQGVPPAHAQAQQEQQQAQAQPRREQTPDVLDHAADEEEPLAAELEAQVRLCDLVQRCALQPCAAAYMSICWACFASCAHTSPPCNLVYVCVCDVRGTHVLGCLAHVSTATVGTTPCAPQFLCTDLYRGTLLRSTSPASMHSSVANSRHSTAECAWLRRR